MDPRDYPKLQRALNRRQNLERQAVEDERRIVSASQPRGLPIVIDIAASMGVDHRRIVQAQMEHRHTLEQLALATEYENGLRAASDAPRSAKTAKPKYKRLTSTIANRDAAKRMEQYRKTKGMTLTEFASRAKTTERTLRKFRKTGTLRISVLRDIAKAMSIPVAELLRKS